GFVCPSSTTSTTLRPSRPPFAFTSSITACIAFAIRGPSKPPAPVSGVSTPSCNGSPCARTMAGATAPRASAPAPISKRRRGSRGMGCISFLRCRCFVLSSSAEKNPPDVGIGGQRPRRSLAMVAAVDENVRAIGDGQGLARILLDYRDRHAVAMDRDDVFEQALRRDRRQTRGRLVEQ